MYQLSKEQEEKKQALLTAVEAIQPVSGFNVPKGFPIPLKDYIFVKIIEGNSGLQETEGGILLTSSIAKNTSLGVTGVIYATGPNCSEFSILGLKVMINEFADFEVMIQGVIYRRIQEQDILGILPPDSWVYLAPKSNRQVEREERKKDFADYELRKKKVEENEKDKLTSKKK